MNSLDQAEAEFRRIWPHGPECAHAYAAEGFRFLAKAREEMDKAEQFRKDTAVTVETLGEVIREQEVERNRLTAEVKKLREAIGTVHAAWNVESGDFCVTTMVNAIEAANRIATACGKGDG